MPVTASLQKKKSIYMGPRNHFKNDSIYKQNGSLRRLFHVVVIQADFIVRAGNVINATILSHL